MLNSLLDKKGALSRKIGEAKRAGQPFDDLLVEMRSVSSEIKALKSKEKNLNNVEMGIVDGAALNGGAKLPNLFCSEYSAELGALQSLTVRECQGSDALSWDQYVVSKENSSLYHRWAFRTCIEKAFGHRAVYFAAFDSLGNIRGVLPSIELNSKLFGHFVVSLPYFTYGGALADSAEIEDSLATAVFAYAREYGVEHVELRATFERASESVTGFSHRKDHKVSMVRSLPETSDQLWQDIGTKVRAQVRKGQRYPFSVKFGNQELLSDFYRVFAENMRDLGTPVYDKKFFQVMLESDLAKSFALGVVYLEGKPVSCCFLMQNKGIMEIPWASTLARVNHMNANMYMYWEVLQFAIAQSNTFFDFGRSSKDAGTYRFKKQWGAKPQQLYWYYWLPEGQALPELNPDNPKYKLLIAVWKRLPVWLTKIIGPLIIKYLP